jgi:hypothetical protein
VVVPGANAPEAIDSRLRAWAANQRLTVEPLAGRAAQDGTAGAGRGGGGFSAALQNLADHSDAATTSTTAKMVGYPTADLTLGDQHRSWRTVLLGIIALTLAILVALAPSSLLRRRRRGSLSLGSADSADAMARSEAP